MGFKLENLLEGGSIHKIHIFDTQTSRMYRVTYRLDKLILGPAEQELKGGHIRRNTGLPEDIKKNKNQY